jgi:hypothetical protein
MSRTHTSVELHTHNVAGGDVLAAHIVAWATAPYCAAAYAVHLDVHVCRLAKRLEVGAVEHSRGALMFGRPSGRAPPRGQSNPAGPALSHPHPWDVGQSEERSALHLPAIIGLKLSLWGQFGGRTPDRLQTSSCGRPYIYYGSHTFTIEPGIIGADLPQFLSDWEKTSDLDVSRWGRSLDVETLAKSRRVLE